MRKYVFALIPFALLLCAARPAAAEGIDSDPETPVAAPPKTIPTTVATTIPTTVVTPAEATPTPALINKPKEEIEALLSDVEKKIVAGGKTNIGGITQDIQSRFTQVDSIEDSAWDKMETSDLGSSGTDSPIAPESRPPAQDQILPGRHRLTLPQPNHHHRPNHHHHSISPAGHRAPIRSSVTSEPYVPKAPHSFTKRSKSKLLMTKPPPPSPT